jgi:PAS domain S-box-containing protein
MTQTLANSIDHGTAETNESPHVPADRYALITEAISEGVYDWHIPTNSLHVAGRLTAITGISLDESSAQDWNQRIHPEDFDSYRRAVIRHFKGETNPLKVEYRLRRASGDYIWVADNGRCMRNDNGEAVRLVGAIRDITARKLAETRLRAARMEAEQARQRLDDGIESISEGIVLFDAEDLVILCNSNFRDYFAKMAGEEVAAMIQPGVLFWDFLRVAHASGMLPLIDEQGGIDAYIEMRKEMRRNPQEPIEQQLADGTWLQINEHKTAEGGIASVYTDVTELKKREVEASAKTEMLESLSSRLSKYLSPQIYSSIFSADDSVEIAPKRKKLTVFFSDIVGFTSLVDALESEELTNLLNQYLTEMSKIAIAHGATVDKFIGDAIFAFFGDPISKGVEHDAQTCVAMALAMQTRLDELRRGWNDKGLDDTFQLRIGITTGFCTVGNFGSEDRLDYTAIGNAVNLAARLQAFAEPGGVLLDYETYHLVKDTIGPAEEIHAPLKGFAKPVRAFNLRRPEETDEISIALVRAGAHIRIDSSALADADRKDAVRVLKRALMDLEEGERAKA